MKESLILMNKTLKSFCSVSSGYEGDRFVGVKFHNGIPEVHFPLGFSLSDTEEDIRNDVLLLIKTLKTFGYKDKQFGTTVFSNENDATLPISAYQRMIQRYLSYGNYTEYETAYKIAKKGRINWIRTIKNIRPLIQCNNAVYTDFVVRDSKAKEHTLIAEIFQYCVYISFERIGWLYSQHNFVKPRIKYNQKLFLNAISEKMSVTYADKDKELFADMYSIVSNVGDDKDIYRNFTYGTYEFEYVWEKLIDSAYGISNKDDYFPKTMWIIGDSKKKKDNRCLEPDTILLYGKYILVLDAKYYRYGVTKNPGHLPETASIQKQITYGEYIHTHLNVSPDRIYNAFVLPAEFTKNSSASEAGNLSFVGVGISEWKRNNYPYEQVAAVLLDTKYIMRRHANSNSLKSSMADMIINNIHINDDRKCSF